jgi:hypothetical protein
MRQRRRVAITVETSRLVVRRSTNRGQVWCPQCSAHVQSVKLEDAAALIGVTQPEAGEYHYLGESQPGLICLNSLFASIDKQNPS